MHFHTLLFVEAGDVGVPDSGKVFFSGFGCEFSAVVNFCVSGHILLFFEAIKAYLSRCDKSVAEAGVCECRIMAL